MTPSPAPSTPASLPPGVPDLSTWGETLIQFGKLSNVDPAKCKTYLEMASDTSESGMSYRKWIMSRRSTGGPELRDLAEWLFAVQEQGDLPTPPLEGASKIPGTTKTRVFRDSSDTESSSTYRKPAQRK